MIYLTLFISASCACHFAPSTVALAALLLAFSKLNMDCTDWLEHVPNICLPSPDHPLFRTPIMLSYLDVDQCLGVFQRLKSVQLITSSGFPSLLPDTPAPPKSPGGEEDRMISPAGIADFSPSRKENPICVEVTCTIIAPSPSPCEVPGPAKRSRSEYEGNQNLDSSAKESSRPRLV